MFNCIYPGRAQVRSVLGLAALFGHAGIVFAAEPASPPPAPAIRARGTLNDADVQKLEEKLQVDPLDIAARRDLLAHYSRAQYSTPEARSARQRHVLWVIENQPESDFRSPEIGLNAQLEGEAYEKGKSLWLKHVDAHPDNLVLLDYAADFLLLFDRPKAETLWKTAQSAEPNNPHWSERLAHLYSLQANFGRTVDATAAAKALTEMERARDVAKTDDFGYLVNLAKMAFSAGDIGKARSYSHALLEQAPGHLGEWNHGNAVHFAHIVLGRAAVVDGKLEEAKQHLLEAGKTPGSPQLNSFGPSMALANDLLQEGEKAVVLSYFDLCRTFWTLGGSKLEEWTAAVKAGTPPDFGPNLRR